MGIEQMTDTVLILGGTSGLGKSIAEEYQDRGDFTIRVGSSVEDQELKDRMLMHCDLKSAEATKDFVERLRGTDRTINRFYWAAARYLEGSFEDIPIEEIWETIDVNQKHPLLIAQYIWRLMQDAKEDRSFVVVSSTSGDKFRPGESIYGMTKFGQRGFAGGIGGEIRNPNLKVTLFKPGGMRTKLYRKDPSKDLSEFMDPRDVAKFMVDFVANQATPFEEKEIPRGSL